MLRRRRGPRPVDDVGAGTVDQPGDPGSNPRRRNLADMRWHDVQSTTVSAPARFSHVPAEPGIFAQVRYGDVPAGVLWASQDDAAGFLHGSESVALEVSRLLLAARKSGLTSQAALRQLSGGHLAVADIRVYHTFDEVLEASRPFCRLDRIGGLMLDVDFEDAPVGVLALEEDRSSVLFLRLTTEQGARAAEEIARRLVAAKRTGRDTYRAVFEVDGGSVELTNLRPYLPPALPTLATSAGVCVEHWVLRHPSQR